MRRLAATSLALMFLFSLAAPTLGASKTIALKPKVVDPGQRVTVFGSGWKGKVTFLIGPANSEAERAGSTKADSDGEILYQGIVIDANTPEGDYVLLACQKDCAVKRSSKFKVKRTLF